MNRCRYAANEPAPAPDGLAGRRVDVAVVGGGPAGSATALLLARAGRDVLLLDARTFPRPKPCGDYLNPVGAQALAHLGLDGALADVSLPLRGMVIVSPGGREVVAPFPAGQGLSVPRDALDAALLQAASGAGVEVRTGVPVIGIDGHGGAWTGAPRRGTWRVETPLGRVEARVLVGADGYRSRVAAAAGLGGAGPRRGRFALALRVRGLRTRPGYAEMHLAHDAYCGVSAFPDGWANVTPVLAPRGLDRRVRRDPAALDTVLARFPRLHTRLRQPGVEVAPGWRAVGPLGFWRRRPAGPGVVLVGDAAGFVDPLTGQGVTLALAGAVRAARVIDAALAHGLEGHPQAFAPYVRWHRRRYAFLSVFLGTVDAVALRPALIEPIVAAWARWPALASAFLGLIGGRAAGPATVHDTGIGWLAACRRRA